MKGYWIALYKKINNSENLKKYGEIVTPIIRNFGGKLWLEVESINV